MWFQKGKGEKYYWLKLITLLWHCLTGQGLFYFVCTIGRSWIWIFVVDGEPSHQDLESWRETQCPKILLWSLNASCFYFTWSWGRPTASHTFTLGFIIVFHSPSSSYSQHTHTHTHTHTHFLLFWIESDEKDTVNWMLLTVYSGKVRWIESKMWLDQLWFNMTGVTTVILSGITILFCMFNLLYSFEIRIWHISKSIFTSLSLI